jgi:hypothetical protein
MIIVAFQFAIHRQKSKEKKRKEKKRKEKKRKEKKRKEKKRRNNLALQISQLN